MMGLNIDEFYTLNMFLNKCTMQTFSKEDLFDVISKRFASKNMIFNEKILVDEINMIIKTYCVDDKIDNPENNFACPLSNLELIKKIGKNLYERNKPSVKKMNYLIVYYLILNVIADNDSMSIDDLINAENGPSKILNLDKILLNDYLDELRVNKLIEVNRTAGLNMIYIKQRMTIAEIFAEYFSGGHDEV